jgi:hypothetical protein
MNCSKPTDLSRHVPSMRLQSSSPLTFLSLPREIRDEIYEVALVSASPIIVWKGSVHWKHHACTFYDGRGNPCTKLDSEKSLPKRCVDEKIMAASLQSLVVNIILCNKVVNHEAAMVFYKRNTFSFLGDHNWDSIVSWLRTIDAVNRNYLASMEMDASQNDRAVSTNSIASESLLV